LENTVRPSLRKKSRTVAQVMEVVPRRDDEEWQRHFEEKQHRQNLQEQANVGTFLSVMALAKHM
jgi:lambda repressor-like predicted transcriptional regulator